MNFSIDRSRPSSADSSRTDGGSENDEKLGPFREKVQAVICSLVDDSLSTEPDQGKGRKKTVQVYNAKIYCQFVKRTLF